MSISFVEKLKSVCEFPLCGNPKEGNTDQCASHNAAHRKAERLALKPKKQFTPIRKVSKKRAQENKQYNSDAEQWFKDNPKCKARLEGCTDLTDHRHHLAGRGIRLNAKETFLPVCSSCHFQIHNVLSAKERRDRGLLITYNSTEPHKI